MKLSRVFGAFMPRKVQVFKTSHQVLNATFNIEKNNCAWDRGNEENKQKKKNA